MEASEAGFTCAICLDDLPPPPARLPCCGTQHSTIQYCADCVAAVCRNGVGGVGRCPTCRAYFTVDSAGTITQCERQDVCAICRQGRLIVAEHRGHPLCDACHFGRAVPLRYECANCSAVQHIPHPMYRYQRTPHEFGTTSWACHRCGDFTMWRVAQADAARVPAADAPESWGRRDEWLAQVRAQRTARLRRGLPHSPRGSLTAFLPSCSCSSASRAGGRLDSTRAQVVAISCFCYCQSATGFIGTVGGCRGYH